MCERESKTKAFSKVGLQLEDRVDPNEAALQETADWLRRCLLAPGDILLCVFVCQITAPCHAAPSTDVYGWSALSEHNVHFAFASFGKRDHAAWSCGCTASHCSAM